MPRKLPPEEAKGAVDRAIEVIRNRIDQFGVAEPIIQREGTNRIVVQLPGLSDRERARQLIGQTALLEFKLVRTTDEAAVVWNRLDGALAARARAGQVAVDSAVASRPLSSYFMDQYNGGAFIASTDVPKVEAMLPAAMLDTLVTRRQPGAVERRRGPLGPHRPLALRRQARARDDRRRHLERADEQPARPDDARRVGRVDPLLGQGPGGLRARHRGERRPPARGRARRRRALGALDPRAHPERQRLDHGLVRLEDREGPRDRAQGRRAARARSRSSRSDRSDPRSARTRSTPASRRRGSARCSWSRSW